MLARAYPSWMDTPCPSRTASLLIDMHGSLARSRILQITLDMIHAGDASQAFWLGVLGAALAIEE